VGETDGGEIGRSPQGHGEYAGNDQRMEAERSRQGMEEVPKVIVGYTTPDLKWRPKRPSSRSNLVGAKESSSNCMLQRQHMHLYHHTLRAVFKNYFIHVCQIDGK
jgi:hypothetical protein